MKNLFKPSSNCWKVAKAQRAAFIIDGANYFRALHEAMREARRSIIIVGWDLHSELRLVRDGECDGYPDKLGELLEDLAEKRKDLNIYLLAWDFAMIYAMEREFFPRYKLKWSTHERVHFLLDGEHPVGASQHQKIVVIDDSIAFSGGLDLSKWRWDTSAHEPENPLRKDPDGQLYPPFHDVQMIVDGDAAKALAELAKQRWSKACGEAPFIDEAIAPGDPWPSSIEPDFNDVEIAIARTLPSYKDSPEVREVERLYLDSLAAAQDFIYIENQYLSSFRIGEALKDSLQQAEGPEIVIVQPKETGGWLEQHTMDVLRGRIIAKLREADRHRRLRLFYPQIAASPAVELMVHAKVMIIDDCFARVGSSNLSNRSLGLDSECDLAIFAETNSAEAAAISVFRNRLIAEHLGVAEHDVAEALTKRGSLIEAIETLRSGDRCLLPLQAEISKEIDRWVPESELLDPEKPIEPEELFDYLISPHQQLSASRHMLTITVLVAGMLCLAAILHWLSFPDGIDRETAAAALAGLKQSPYALPIVVTGFVLGGLLAFPVTLMIILTVIIFGPWQGLLYTLVGAETSAVSTFLLGRRLGRDAVNRLTGNLVNRLRLNLTESGFKGVLTYRIIPVAPFTVINLIAGISGIRSWDFAFATFIGLLPGLAVIVIVAQWIADFIHAPKPAHFAALLGATIVVGIALAALWLWLRRRHR